MGFFILGYDVAYYADVGDLDVLGNLVVLYEETCVCSIDISDSLE